MLDDSMGTGVVLLAGMRTGRNVVGVDRDNDDDMVTTAWERAKHYWLYLNNAGIVCPDQEPAVPLEEKEDWLSTAARKVVTPVGTTNHPEPRRAFSICSHRA